MSGGSHLSTHTVAECCVDFPLQVRGTGVKQLADQQAKGESSGQPHGAYPLRRREHAVPLHMCC